MPAKIAVIIYSVFGNTDKLAQAVIAGARSTGAQVDVYQCADILTDEIRAKMHAAPRLTYPIINAADLVQYDGLLFAAGTRFGRMPASVSALLDSTGKLWSTGALMGKMAGVVSGSSTQHGGQETTAFTTLPFFAHQGMIFVPIGYGAPEISDEAHIVGGSPYGASFVGGPKGTLGVQESDLRVGEYQGESFAETCNTFVKGKEVLAAGKAKEKMA